tara:strand:+ start:195 stop:581 length:387 start_codon:yes stop_codon:yes gene_type:complete
MNLELENNPLGNHAHWILRIVLATTFIMHGYSKLGYDMGMGFVGYFVGIFEVFGAIFLLVGPFTKDIITRVGGLMISIIMIGAIFVVHLGQGWKMHATAESIPYTQGFEWQALLLGVSLLFVLKGNKT